jgi:hypothetical protein
MCQILLTEEWPAMLKLTRDPVRETSGKSIASYIVSGYSQQ